MVAACELCDAVTGEIVYRCDKYRIVLVDDMNYPGFCRVIWNRHVQEITDLPGPDRALLMHAVWQVEQALREIMLPDKVNLASFGNLVPHVHWHVIPRYRNDTHFPQPVWGTPQRVSPPESLAWRVALLPALRAAISRFAGPDQ